ncbi:hypothetical protein MRX96_000139 [Rhipicephalus microplus]
MAEKSPPFSARPFKRPSRPLSPTSPHRCSVSVACTRILWNLNYGAKEVKWRHEQAQRLQSNRRETDNPSPTGACCRHRDNYKETDVLSGLLPYH